MLRPPIDKSWRAYYASVGQDAVTSAQQVALAITFLPHQAWVAADAIVRTLWRLFVSHRNLLEWQTASQTERVVAGGRATAWRTMWPAVALAVGLLVAVVAVALTRRRGERPALGSSPRPWFRWWRSGSRRPPSRTRSAPRRRPASGGSPSPAARPRPATRCCTGDSSIGSSPARPSGSRRTTSRRIPLPAVAMRTSPTNVGLQLLSTVSAYDLGFITAEDLTRRLERVMQSLERMQRFRGHFYNWYDLHDLRVLEPAYISTVDSGNLAGHLIALRQACLGIPTIRRSMRGCGAPCRPASPSRRSGLAASASFDETDTPGRPELVAAAQDELRRAAAALAAAAAAGTPAALSAEVAPALIACAGGGRVHPASRTRLASARPSGSRGPSS